MEILEPESNGGGEAEVQSVVAGGQPVGRRRIHRRRAVFAAVCACALVIAVVAVEHGRGHPHSTAARSARLVADAKAVKDDPNTAVQLAVAAYRASPTAAAADLLYTMLDEPPDTVVDKAGSGVLRVATQKDGGLAAATYDDGTLRIWNAAGPAAPVLEATVRAQPTALALAPHNPLLAGPCTDKALCLWNLTDPKKPAVISKLPLPAHPTGASGAPMTSMAISPDGTSLAAAAENGATVVWSIAQPTHPRVVADLANPAGRALSNDLAAVAFSPHGDLLATTVQDGRTGLWNVSDPGRPSHVATIRTGYQALTFSPDGSLLAAAGDTKVGLWKLADPSAPAAVDIGSACAVDQVGSALDLHAIAFSPDGTQLAYSGEDTADHGATMCVLDPSPLNLYSGSPTAISTPTDFSTLAMAYTAGGALFTGGQDGAVRSWRSPIPQVDGVDTIDGVPWETWGASPNGHLLAAPVETPGGGILKPWSFGIWDVSGAGGPVLDATVHSATRAISFLTDSVLMTVASNGAVRLWDLTDPRHPVRASSLGSAVIPTTPGWAFSGEITADTAGHLVAVLGPDARLHLWRLTGASATEAGSIPASDASEGPAGVLPDGRTALLETPAGIDWWDIADPARPSHGGFSPLLGVNVGMGEGAGSVMAVADAAGPSGDGATLHLVKVVAGSPRTTSTLTRSAASRLAVSADSRLLAVTGTGNKTLTLWDIRDPGHPRDLTTVQVPKIQGIAFDTAGDRMTDWNEKTVQVWDVRKPSAPVLQAAITLPDPVTSTGQQVTTVSLSPSGRRLVVATRSHLFLYDADPADLANRLCTYVGSPISAAKWKQYAPGVAYRNPCP